MFEKLFAEGGLSLDRLKAFLAVAAAGSIIKAAGGDAVRQSQYSRQIKELEDFFRTNLVERQGKGIRLTASGRELARVSRFFMLGLSNFRRGCLTERQTFRIGASATFIRQFFLPAAASAAHPGRASARYVAETVTGDEVERRLHDLTLDFAVTTRPQVSRPLQLAELGKWRLRLCGPAVARHTERSALAALKADALPLVSAKTELADCGAKFLDDFESRIVCETFVEAVTVLERGHFAALLPDFLNSGLSLKLPSAFRFSTASAGRLSYRLAWNPRLLRLNPHAIRERDFLVAMLREQMRR
jgi:DNA-binding transcriptional LysR family regulator